MEASLNEGTLKTLHEILNSDEPMEDFSDDEDEDEVENSAEQDDDESSGSDEEFELTVDNIRALEIRGANVILPQVLHNYDSLIDWSYEMRRTYQNVGPKLYVGPSRCLNDKESIMRMQLHEIGGVVMLCTEEERRIHSTLSAPLAGMEMVRFLLDLHSDPEPTYDELVDVIKQANGFIDRKIKMEKKNVLIVSLAGDDRAPLLGACYLIHAYRIDPIPALKIVANNRFSLNLSEFFTNTVLQFYYDEIKNMKYFIKNEQKERNRSENGDQSEKVNQEVQEVERKIHSMKIATASEKDTGDLVSHSKEERRSEEPAVKNELV